jgi:hypothetical protein
LLHYTDMERQPWVSRQNPLAYLWFRDLFEAVDTAFIGTDVIEDHVRAGFVRPSLAYQVRHRIEDPLLLPKEAAKLDDGYMAPFQSIPKHRGTPWRDAKAVFLARLRRALQQSVLYKLQRRVRSRVAFYLR